MKKTLSVFAFIMIFAASALAYDGRTITASFNVGMISPSESELLGGVNTGLGYAVDGDFHYYFNDYIGIGGFLSYSGIPLDKFDGIINGNAANDIDTTFTSFILGLSASLRYPTTHFDFFLTGGVGLAMNSWEQEYKSGGVATKVTDDDTGVAFKIGAGARYYVTEMFSLGLAAGYIINEMDTQGIGTDGNVKLNGITGEISAGFAF